MFTSSSTLTEQSARADGEEALMPAKRRTRIEPGIYTRPDGRYEIGWGDAAGRQRWREVGRGMTAGRKALRAELSKRDRGEKVAADPRLRFDAAADAWWGPRHQAA